jgi:hypothetical protein
VEVTSVDLNDAKLTGGADLGGVELASNKELSDAQKATPYGARRQRAEDRVGHNNDTKNGWEQQQQYGEDRSTCVLGRSVMLGAYHYRM